MAMTNSKGARLVALFFLGALLFNYPILSLFNRPILIGGIPLLYLYFFLSWLLIIALVCIATSLNPDSTMDPEPDTPTTMDIPEQE